MRNPSDSSDPSGNISKAREEQPHTSGEPQPPVPDKPAEEQPYCGGDTATHDTPAHDAGLIAVAANDDTATHIHQVRTREWLLHGPSGACAYLLHNLRGVGIAPAITQWIEAEKAHQRRKGV